MAAHRPCPPDPNVVGGVRRVGETSILRRAWRRGANLPVHGLICGLKDGRLRDLDCSVGPGHFQSTTPAQEASP